MIGDAFRRIMHSEQAEDSLRTAGAAAGVIWATVMLHELGHAAATAALGGKIDELSFGFGPEIVRWGTKPTVHLRAIPLGGYAKVDLETLVPRDRIKVFLAGPLLNVAAGLLILRVAGRPPRALAPVGRRRGLQVSGAIGALRMVRQAARHSPRAVAAIAGAINVSLGLANLLPLYPLDGGMVTTTLLEERNVPERQRSTFRKVTAGIMGLIVLGALVTDVRRWWGAVNGGAGGGST